MSFALREAQARLDRIARLLAVRPARIRGRSRDENDLADRTEGWTEVELARDLSLAALNESDPLAQSELNSQAKTFEQHGLKRLERGEAQRQAKARAAEQRLREHYEREPQRAGGSSRKSVLPPAVTARHKADYQALLKSGIHYLAARKQCSAALDREFPRFDPKGRPIPISTSTAGRLFPKPKKIGTN